MPAWAWVLSTFGISDAVYDNWKLPFMLAALTVVVFLSVKYAKPWVTSLLICICGLALAFKLDSDGEYMPFAVAGWVAVTSVISALVYRFRRKAAAQSCCGLEEAKAEA